MLNWIKFKSYLKGINQFVEIQNFRSSMRSISKGVPQGSILGPLLFLIYINDMNECTQLKIFHYADASTAYIASDSLDSLTHFVNSELVKIDDWLRAN